MTFLLIATAVEAEAEAIRRGLSREAEAEAGAVRSPDRGAATVTDANLRSGGADLRGGGADLRGGAADLRGWGEGAETGRVGWFGAVTVAAVGVGPAAAAAGTARLLALAEAAGRPYGAVLSAGIGGGFPGRAGIGAVVLGARSIAADLGAESPEGFLPIDELGFGSAITNADPELLKALATALPEAVTGDILTLSTVTGTAASTDRLAARFPAAAAEGMEGHGVACAAAGLPFAELRAISNAVGPRDRAAWQIGTALQALTEATRALTTSPA